MMQYPGTAITDRYPTRSLCGKRYDNAAPFASSSSGLPHTCFEDVVLVPLASWIFYIALLAFLALLVRQRAARAALPTSRPHQLIFRSMRQQDAQAAGASLGPHWPKTTSAFSILHFLLILATLLMNILEIVRLALANRGIGLLPFTLASLVLIIVLRLVPMSLSRQVALYSATLVFWVLALVFTAVKEATLMKLDTVEPRTGTEYLSSDQRLDVGVILGLYGLSLIVDSWRLLRVVRRRNHSSATDSSNEGIYEAHKA